MTATWEEPVVRHRVVPFHLLTDRQAAEHMVACHGFDEDYFANGNYDGFRDDRTPTREEALTYWESHAWTRGAGEHADEHSPSWGGVGGGVPHTHTKAPR